MTPKRRRYYRQGHCDAMALALHRLTGLPLVKIVGLRTNRSPRRKKGENWCEEPAHIAVKAGRYWLDVDGLHQDVPAGRLAWLRKPDKIAIRPSSVRETTFTFSLHGVPEDEIFTAMKDAIDDPVLGDLIIQLRKPARERFRKPAR